MTRERKPRPRRRGSITKTEQGGYLARIRLAPDALTGKRGGSSKTFDAKIDAETWLADELARLDRGEILGAASERQTLGAFLREFYAVHRKTTKGDGVLSERTCQADLSFLELYVLRRAPGLADTPLQKLTVQTFREHFRTLSASGLAAATVSRVHRTLRARLAYAVAEGKLRHNPMVDARIPVSGKKKRARAVLTGPQAAALFAVCPESRIGTYVATLLWTGMRPGEGAGLTWEDVDLDVRVLHIRRALIRVAPTAAEKGQGTSWVLGPTKTDRERDVPIPDVLVAMLRRHRAEQAESKLAAGPEYENAGLVFASDFGRPLHLDTITSRYLKPLLRRAALQLAGEAPLPMPAVSRAKAYTEAVRARHEQEEAAITATGFPMGVGLYSLRHSFASRLASDGVSVELIAKTLGHSSVVTTLSSYIHSDDEAARRALGKLEDAFLPKTGRLGVA